VKYKTVKIYLQHSLQNKFRWAIILSSNGENEMNYKEELEMILMCVQARIDEKQLQRTSSVDSRFVDTNESIIGIISSIYLGDKYRIKPEPKTMKCRIFLTKDGYGMYSPRVAYNQWNEYLYESSLDFVKWITDEITVELPE